MFIYLSKKIAIPNQVNLRCISWNAEDGHIAVGGDDGLLKVLKLESPKQGIVATSNLSMNQTLEGHNGSVQLMVWNEKHQRLTTSDSSGLIIVWMLHKGAWFEEMINNRNKSVVKGMAWSGDGQRICIIYDDGAIIVGSVDGNRLWGKELKGVSLQLVEWSADGKYLLFGVRSGEIHIYDQGGNFISKMSGIQTTSNSNIVEIKWHKRGERLVGGVRDADVAVLAIATDEGHIQLLKKEVDPSPILIDCDMMISGLEWSPSGNMIAVIGRLLQAREPDKKNVIKLFSNQGQYLHTLVVPGKQITGCTWEGTGLRLAVSVDSFIYFVNVRPDYNWCYFADCVLFTHSKADRPEQCFTIWDTKNGQKHINFRRGVLAIAASNTYAAIATANQAGIPDQFNIEVWDNIGALVDQVIIEGEPVRMALWNDVVAIGSHCDIYIWHFRDTKQRVEMDRVKAQEQQKNRITKISNSESDSKFALSSSPEEICCMTAGPGALIVAFESGLLKRYNLPNVSLSHKYNLSIRPKMIALNCTNSMLSVIDMSGTLHLFDVESESGKAKPIDFQRRDVWDVRWAWDEPELFAYMEKTRLVIVHRLESEDAVTCSGYICAIEQLRVKCVLLDEILATPQSPSIRSHILTEDTSLLRQLNELLESATIADVVQFIEDNDSNVILWRKMAKFYMISGDLDAAEMALVRIRDWDGILFCRRIAKLASREVREAEVLSYHDEFDEAEQIFINNDRVDLAIEMHSMVGNWERVIELALTSNESNIALIEAAYNQLGQTHMENGYWNKAIHCFEKSHNQEGLATARYMTEDFDGLWKVAENVTEKELLFKIGEMFESVGMCDEAVHCFVHSNAHTRALEVCIELNEWKTAIELARDHGQVADVSGLLAKYARQFIEKDNILSAVELYRRAGRFKEAARLLNELARSDRVASSILKKQIYVLAAMLADQGKSNRLNKIGPDSNTQPSVLLGDDNLWRYAQAYHFLVLAQRQFYREKYEQALITALHLKEYDDILNRQTVYQLIALTSVMCGAWGHCSRALTFLETSDGFTAAEREQLEEVSIQLFSKNVPKQNKVENSVCLGCGIALPDGSTLCPTCGVRYPLCVASGGVVTDSDRAWRCGQCKHCALRGEVLSFVNCPLCHFPKPSESNDGTH